MSTRRYTQTRRAEMAGETRRRILEAVGQRLREDPTGPLSLDKVAAQAGVSRSTIYADFGSRAGLFDAFVVDLWDRTGLPALTAAVATADARAHLRDGIAAASRMKAGDLEVYRVLHAMDRLDPDSAGGAVRAMERVRRRGMEDLAHHLDSAGVLREDVPVERAGHVLWVLTSFESLDLLLTGQGLSVDDAVDVLVGTAEVALCRPAP